DRPTEGAGNHGSIIGAGDGHRHLLGGAIAGGKGIGVLHHVAGVEVLHRALVEGKGPGAAGEGERAVTVVAGAGRDIGKGRVVVGIDVTDGERAAGCVPTPRASDLDRPTEGAGNHGSIIGAGDGHRHLLGGAIAGGKGIGVLHHVRSVERRVGDVCMVWGPVAVGRGDSAVTVVVRTGIHTYSVSPYIVL